MKTWWGKTLMGLGALLFLMGLALLSANTKSKNSVERYKDQLRAAGEKWTIDEMLPLHVDSTNNCLPIIQNVLAILKLDDTNIIYINPPPAMRMVAPGKAMVGWRESEIWSGDGVNTWEEAEGDLENVSNVLALLQSIPEDAHLDFELDYHQGLDLLLPHLAPTKRIAQCLSAFTVFNLHKNDTISAITNLHTLLKVITAWNKEPLVISQLVRMAMTSIALNVQWELLQSTNLTDLQLAGLQQDWANLEFIKTLEKALMMERAWLSVTIQKLRTSTSPSTVWGAGGGMSSGSAASGDWLDQLKQIGQSAKRKTSETLWRVSWSFNDELNMLKGYQVQLEGIRKIHSSRIFKNSMDKCERDIEKLHLDATQNIWLRSKLDDEALGFILGSAGGLSSSLKRLLGIEVAKTMTVTALALKRYQLVHDAYPADLNKLVPQFLPAVPLDPVDGQPLRYHLNSDGTFLLYSIGEDGNDDGGDPTPVTPTKNFNWWQKGRDWVWPTPATRTEIEIYQNDLLNRRN